MGVRAFHYVKNVKNFVYFGGIKMKKKILSLLLSLALVFGLTACGGGGGGGKVELTFYIPNAGFGIEPITDQIGRFNQIYPDITIELDTISEQWAPDSDVTHAYYQGPNFREGLAKNWWLDLTEIFTEESIYGEEGVTIESKIPEEQRFAYKNQNDGHYYGSPAYSHYIGLSYDWDLFKARGYFLGKNENDQSEQFDSTLIGESYIFTKDMNNLTVGPDGTPGTQDDGCPSSLFEMVALCEYITSESDDTIDPFMTTGLTYAKYYTNYMTHAIAAALLGYDNYESFKTFTSDEAWVVVDVDPVEKAFPGWDESPAKPIVAKVKYEPSSGYYHSWTVEKYYAMAFTEMAHKLGWYTSSTYLGTTHHNTQYRFIFGELGASSTSDQGAMLAEGSYWHNESLKDPPLNFTYYEMATNKKPDDRHLYWMSLPVNIMTTVTGEDVTYVPTDYAFETEEGVDYTNQQVVCRESKKGEAPFVFTTNGNGGGIVYNNRYKDDPEIMDAIKKWILFIYSDSELSKYTAKGCYRWNVNYTVDQADVEEYGHEFDTKMWELVESGKISNTFVEEGPFRNNLQNYRFNNNGQDGYFGFARGTGDYGSKQTSAGLMTILQYFNDPSMNPSTTHIFVNRTYNANQWFSEVLNGGEYGVRALKYPEGHIKAGEWIKCELIESVYETNFGSIAEAPWN